MTQQHLVKEKLLSSDEASEMLVRFKEGNPEFDKWLESLRKLSSDQRRALFQQFCVACGSTDTWCQCWNDE